MRSRKSSRGGATAGGEDEHASIRSRTRLLDEYDGPDDEVDHHKDDYDHGILTSDSVSPSGRTAYYYLPEGGDDDVAEDGDDGATTRNWWSFFLLGLLNNFSYVVITSGSRSLAESFNKLQLLGVLQYSLVAAGLPLRALNAFVCYRFSTHTRIQLTGLCFLVGYLGLTIAPFFSFEFAIASILLIGAACSFGESVLLGYLRKFPVPVTSGWSSGTGMAGVGGALFYMMLWAALHGALHCTTKSTLFLVYAMMAISAPLYLLTYHMGVRHPPPKLLSSSLSSSSSSSLMSPTSSFHQDGHEDHTRSTTTTMSTQRVMRVLGLVLVQGLHLGAVYFLEYCVSVGFAAHAVATDHTGDFELDGFWTPSNSFVTLSLCYQTGVLLSRSSLGYLRIPPSRIWVLTALQVHIY